MKVKDIVRSSALILGKTDVVDYLDGQQDVGVDTLESINLLTNLCTLVIDELSSTYIPLVQRETASFANGKYAYNQFSKKVVKIIAVYNMEGKSVDFSTDANCVLSNVMNCEVEYEYRPENYDLEDNVGYSESDISITALAYGVTAEYCITQGLFEQAVMHHKRYVDAVAEVCLPKNKKIKPRSWV